IAPSERVVAVTDFQHSTANVLPVPLDETVDIVAVDRLAAVKAEIVAQRQQAPPAQSADRLVESLAAHGGRQDAAQGGAERRDRRGFTGRDRWVRHSTSLWQPPR